MLWLCLHWPITSDHNCCERWTHSHNIKVNTMVIQSHKWKLSVSIHHIRHIEQIWYASEALHRHTPQNHPNKNINKYVVNVKDTTEMDRIRCHKHTHQIRHLHSCRRALPWTSSSQSTSLYWRHLTAWGWRLGDGKSCKDFSRSTASDVLTVSVPSHIVGYNVFVVLFRVGAPPVG